MLPITGLLAGSASVKHPQLVPVGQMTVVMSGQSVLPGRETVDTEGSAPGGGAGDVPTSGGMIA